MKALASDLDGTLYFEDIEGHYKQSDLDKIKDFQAKGHLFGICTGRPFAGLINHFQQRVHLDFYIVSSGALILDKDFHVIEKQIISLNIVKDLYLRYKNIVGFFVQGKEAMYVFEINEAVDILQIIIHDLDEIKEEIYGVSFNAYNEENALRICKEINYYYSELEAFQNKQYIDIAKKGCSKGSAVKKIKQVLNIDRIAGIGDSYNDIPMLKSADISFTFHSSPKIVKDKATFIVDSIEEAIDKI